MGKSTYSKTCECCQKQFMLRKKDAEADIEQQIEDYIENGDYIDDDMEVNNEH